MRYALAAVAALVACAPAGAANQIVGFGISGSNFARVGSATSEYPGVGTPGSGYAAILFQETVDPTADFLLTNVPAKYSFMEAGHNGFLYDVKYTAALDRLEIYMDPAGISLSQSDDDIYAVINNAFSGTPHAGEFDIASATSPGGYWTAQNLYAAVPEPASWAMMIAGFGLVGGAMRTSRLRRLTLASSAR